MAGKSERAIAWFFAALFIFSSSVLTIAVIIQMIKGDDTSSQTDTAQTNQTQQEDQVNKEPLDGYAAQPFDKAAVTELKVEELKPGTGKEASAQSTVQANYFGWTSDGKIFDSSKRDGVVSPATFPLNQVIPGWTQGLTGVKEGAVVKLTIPADKAYGATGSPPVIGPNEPLTFIVELKAVQ